jgi:hypothetical protein
VKIWDKMQGWKQTISLIYWMMAVPLVPMWFPGNTLAGNISTSIGVILSAIGISSSLAKKYQTKISEDSNA